MIIYQVYPRSFGDSNHDGIGDLPGITAHLDHIKSLGVDLIWVSPFFKSPMRDFGYDVSDYRQVDPMFGSFDDFRELVAGARALDMGIMVDMVISHTSDEHPWFKASRARSDGKADWYLWADAQADGSPPNNWMSVFGGGAWQWNAARRQYYFHTFLDSQPDLDLNNVEVQDQVLAEMQFWLDEGVAGFRFDACNHYFQDAQLRSNPPVADPGRALHPYGWQEHLYDKNRPEVLPFLERVRTLLDRHDAFSIAEVGGADGLRHMIDYVAPGRLHSGYSFELLRADGSAEYVRRVLEELDDRLPGPGVACHALSNHDKPRVGSRWGAGRDGVAHAKQMLALLSCLKGTICLYQGDELGLPEAEVPFDCLQDPFGKRFWPEFKGRDGCRTPMPWTGEASGFSTASPWLPIDPRHLAMNVESQDRDPASVLSFAREAMAFRRAHPALLDGSIEFSDAGPGVLSFRRELDDRSIACVFNLDNVEHEVPVVFDQPALVNGTRRALGITTLEPCGFVIYESVMAGDAPVINRTPRLLADSSH